MVKDLLRNLVLSPALNGPIVSQFNRLFYYGSGGRPSWQTVQWMGIPALKCPFDTWMYQEILFETKPELIIETGVHRGGTTLYLAGICDLLGLGNIIAVDVSLSLVDPRVHKHPRIRLIEGSSTDPEIVSSIVSGSKNLRTMVILDSDHSEKHVLDELNAYGPIVSKGCYLICEDTNTSGPMKALKRYLAHSPGWKIDKGRERCMVSFSPSGYLLRTG